MPTVKARTEDDPQPIGVGPSSGSASGSGENGDHAEEQDGDRRGLSGFAEDVLRGMMRPLDAVLLSRERIQAVLDDAAERGRITRTDANDLAAELVRLGRQQTEELLDRARRTVGGAPAFPIEEYDQLTVAQVSARLPGLQRAQLRRIRDYERSHANRKGVLDAIEELLN
jgi:polyhydroxyalkanoate synthesis regulator phasin